MEKNAPPNKILIAVDGSEQSLNAIRYAAGMFSPKNTHIVLFHIQAKISELFADLGAYPHYKRRMTGLKRWATDQKTEVLSTMDSAAVYFKQKGFPESAITIKTPTRSLGVTDDIVKESYNDYQAVVVGRTGVSRFKDWVFKSTAMKLVPKIKHIPIVVVGGHPESKNLLMAFDGTHGAMKGVLYAGSLIGKSDHHMMLYSIIRGEKKFWPGDAAFLHFDNAKADIDTGTHEIGPHLTDACKRLLDEGIAPEQVSIKIHVADGERGYRIVNEAKHNRCGTVVMGRRELITFIDEYFIGRVSDKVLKLADELALWIV
ncbi:UspA domain protein [Desulfosarcina variabilis str. Montpellier]|uniref:universal stress protein n=1 Tax=Desulfosarcina variabilis TaxID=2300 RepID=UPI003AFB1569